MDFETIDSSKLYCIYKVYHEGRWIMTHSRKTADHVYSVLCDYNKCMYPKKWDKYGTDYFHTCLTLYYCHKINNTFLSLDCTNKFTVKDLETFAEYADFYRDAILKGFGIVQKKPCSWVGFFKNTETTAKEFLLG